MTNEIPTTQQEATIAGQRVILNPKRFSSGRTGWYSQLLVTIGGKTYKGSVMLYGEKP